MLQIRVHVRRIAPVALVIATATVSLAGCTSSSLSTVSPVHAHMSRVKYYATSDALTADSARVVVGTVTTTRVVHDITGDPTAALTISTVRVDQSVASNGAVAATSFVEVRQFGKSADDAPVPLLRSGQRYLLFLTASGLPGDLAKQFYVTGADAGIYLHSASAQKTPPLGSGSTERGQAFSQVVSDDGDDLPAVLTLPAS